MAQRQDRPGWGLLGPRHLHLLDLLLSDLVLGSQVSDVASVGFLVFVPVGMKRLSFPQLCHRTMNKATRSPGAPQPCPCALADGRGFRKGSPRPDFMRAALDRLRALKKWTLGR